MSFSFRLIVRIYFRLPLLKKVAFDNRENQAGETVASTLRVRANFRHCALIGELEPAALSVDQQLLDERLAKLRLPAVQQRAKLLHVLESRAVWQRAGTVKLMTALLHAPDADRVVVFQRESIRIDLAVATGALSILAMLLQDLP